MLTYYIEANDTPMGEYKAKSKFAALRAYRICTQTNEYIFDDKETRVFHIKKQAIFRAVSEKCHLAIEQDCCGEGVCLVGGISYPNFKSLCDAFDLDFNQFLTKA